MYRTARPITTAACVTILALVAALSVAVSPAAAATFQVTANRISVSETDPDPDGCQPQDCSLREAVLAANETVESDVITFAKPGLIILTQTGPDYTDELGEFGMMEDLDVRHPLTIQGLGAVDTVIATDFRTEDDSATLRTDESRIFDATAPLSLADVTLRLSSTTGDGGLIRAVDDVTLTGAVLEDASGFGTGGALAIRDADLIARNTTFRDNQAELGGGAVALEGFGEILISLSDFDANRGSGVGGGAILAAGANRNSVIEIERSSFTDNHDPDQLQGLPEVSRGGAIHLQQGRLFVDESLFVANGARNGEGGVLVGTKDGGAIYAAESTTEEVGIFDTVFVGNAATHRGGTLALSMSFGEVRRSLIANTRSRQAAVHADNGAVLSIVNSTITGSNAEQSAALEVFGGAQVAVAFSTITDSELPASDAFAGNAPAAVFASGTDGLTLISTIVSGTSGAPNCGGSGITSLGHNLSDDDSCHLTEPSDLANTDPKIGPLADNGGPLQGSSQTQEPSRTHLPSASSPAVDSATAEGCVAMTQGVDQRLVPRPQGTVCDRGAHEIGQVVDPNPTDPPTDNPTDQPTADPTPTSPEPTPSEPAPTSPPTTVVACDQMGTASAQAIPDGVSRVAGPTRIQTAVAASETICGSGGAPAVVLSRSDNFPDAQAGTPLALSLGAPLLLSGPDALHPDTEAEIRRVLAPGGTVHMLGGSAALSAAVEDRLHALGYATTRYAGSNRFETAALIATDGLDDLGSILLADGGDFASAIVAGSASPVVDAVAPGQVAAVLLTSGNVMPPETQVLLDTVATDIDVLAIGQSAAAAAPTVEAIAGTTPVGTAVAVAERFFPDPEVVGIARVDDFADGLAGGAVMGRESVGPGPMLLVPSGELPKPVGEWFVDHTAGIRSVLIFGGTVAVSAEVEAAIPID